MGMVKLVCFSPTGTTNAVVQGIADGINSNDVELVDITTPDARNQTFMAAEEDLLVIGVPVYMGRVPAVLEGWLSRIQLQGTPVVCVVVYGNRAYDNALLELKDIMKSRGGIPVAAAAFIGEHSFSNSETSSKGRPHKEDLDHARAFGQRIHDKLQSATSISEMNEVEIPGSSPYGGITELWSVDFIEVSDQCTHCGLCSKVCPVGAVSAEDSSLINQKECITCCACLKQCPQQARKMKAGPVKEAQKRINTLFPEPKEPEIFL